MASHEQKPTRAKRSEARGRSTGQANEQIVDLALEAVQEESGVGRPPKRDQGVKGTPRRVAMTARDAQGRDAKGRERVVVVDVDIPLWRMIYLQLEFMATFLAALLLLVAILAGIGWLFWYVALSGGGLAELEQFLRPLLNLLPS